MLLDALTLLSNAAPLTAIAAGGTGYSDVLDLSVARDLGPSDVPMSVQFTTLPAAAGGTTINIALQTSVDNATWSTIIETAPQPVAGVDANNPFMLRTEVPAGRIARYLRFAYSPSAQLTAGAVTAQIGGDWPRHPYYSRNFVA